MTPSTRLALLAAALTGSAMLAASSAQAATAFRLDVHFSKTPAKLTDDNMPAFRVSRNVHYHVKTQTCRIDAVAWKACANQWRPGRVTDGTHTAQVRLTLTDGRSATVAYRWATDTVAPPAPTLAGAGRSWQQLASQAVSLTDTATDVDHYSFRLNGGAAVTGGHFSVASQGVTAITAVAIDKAGNVSAPATGYVKLDDIAPVVSAPQDLPQWTGDISIPLAAGSDSGSGVAAEEWRSSSDNGQTWSEWFPRSQDPTVTVPSDGLWVFQYRVTDRAGNQTTVGFAQDQDSTPPPAPYVYGGQADSVTGPVSLNVGQCCDDPESGITGDHQYEISTDGGDTWGDPVDGVSFTPTDPGSYMMRARTENNAGLWSDWTTPDADATEMYDPAPAVPVVTGGQGSSVVVSYAGLDFEWQPVADPADANYQMQYQWRLNWRTETDPFSDTDWQEPLTTAWPGLGLTTGGCSIIVIEVRAIGKYGATSDWSQITDGSTAHLNGCYTG
jgi:hypothetical protein